MIIKFVMSKVPNIKRRFLWFGDKEAEGIYSFFFFWAYILLTCLGEGIMVGRLRT